MRSPTDDDDTHWDGGHGDASTFKWPTRWLIADLRKWKISNTMKGRVNVWLPCRLRRPYDASNDGKPWDNDDGNSAADYGSRL